MEDIKYLDVIISIEKIKKLISGTLLGKNGGLRKNINKKNIVLNIRENFKYFKVSDIEKYLYMVL